MTPASFSGMASEYNAGIPRRVRSRVDELPPEARERMDEMLADRINYTYQDIADELTEAGYPISKSAIGRYVMRTNKEMREITLMVKQQEALLYWMKDNPNYDAAQASLALLISRLSSRIINEPDMVGDIDADKAVGHIIRAIRASTQMERLAQIGGKASADARAQVMDEVRDALQKKPELYEQLMEMVGGGTDG